MNRKAKREDDRLAVRIPTRTPQGDCCCTIPAMPADSKIRDFIERAKASGASEATLVGILTARGWPEKDVYEALAEHYEKVTAIEIPRRSGSATAAKDAFFYLLIFATLATWTFGLGSLAFTLIDERLADPLFSPAYSQAYDTFTLAAAIASILVAFPIYLLVSRAVIRDARNQPEKLGSPVRKWLTYLALVIAAGVFIGDLITALTYFLRGEITSRFLAKAFVVFVISGGVFYYYFSGIKQLEETAVRGKLSKHAWMAAFSALVVATMVILGFSHIGMPKTQRTLRADQKRIQDLFQLSSQIGFRWMTYHQLPQHLDEIPNAILTDPITRTAYEYHPKQGSEYELCGTFSLESRQSAGQGAEWSHPAGRHCFQLDASQPAENPNIYFPD
jgi:Domain of unknown function (DUF5671)